MASADKTAAVAEIVDDFRTANATVLTEYRGLSATLLKQLRRSLGVKNKYSVVKNTLTKIAAKEAGETEYWLLLCKESEGYPDSDELLSKLLPIQKLLSKIISTSKGTSK